MKACSDARIYCCHDKYIAHSRLSIFIIALHVELTRGTLGRRYEVWTCHLKGLWTMTDPWHRKHLERKVKPGKSKPKLRELDPAVLPAAWQILRW